MAKYNEFENDDYLLKTNLLGMTNFAELEQAEAFTFSIRATQIEQGAYNIMAFSLTNFVGLHRHLFPRHLLVCRTIPRCAIDER